MTSKPPEDENPESDNPGQLPPETRAIPVPPQIERKRFGGTERPTGSQGNG